MRQISLFMLVACCTAMAANAQDDGTSANRVSPKELAIPPSPVFDLMGAVPSQVTRLADIKDFKVDWSLKYGINPNLAVQAQPIWEFFYNRKDLARYQSASGFMRHLATLDLSVGTIQDENSYRRAGGAIKLNLFREKDPLMQRELYEDISIKYKNEKLELEKQLKELQYQLDTTTNVLVKPDLRLLIKSTEEQLNSQNSRRMAEINQRAKIFVDENWNASSLDFCVGRIFTFKSDSSNTFGMKRNNRSTGWGAWLSGNLGIGKKLLLTGLVRYFKYDEQVDFRILDVATSTELNAKVIAENAIFSTGLNLRYGGSLYTFFVEFLYESKRRQSPMDIVTAGFLKPPHAEIVGSSLQWNETFPNAFSIGGDWRIGRSVVINYGMRCIMDSKMKFRTFIPMASISCLMR